MRHIHRDIVSALIFSKDGRLLQGKKDPVKGGVYAECWHIPGGGIDEGEDKVAALIREVKEETSLDISNVRVEFIDDQGRGESEKTLKDTGEKVLCEMTFNVYRVDLAQSADELLLQPTDDLRILKWFPPGELKDIKLTPPSEALFRRLGYL